VGRETPTTLAVIVSASAGRNEAGNPPPLNGGYRVNPQKGNEYIGENPNNTPTPGPISVLVGPSPSSALVVPVPVPSAPLPDHRPPKPTPCPN
jgi:hypothetical protein